MSGSEMHCLTRLVQSFSVEVAVAVLSIVISVAALAFSVLKILDSLGINQDAIETTSAIIETTRANQVVQCGRLDAVPCKSDSRELAIFQ